MRSEYIGAGHRQLSREHAKRKKHESCAHGMMFQPVGSRSDVDTGVLIASVELGGQASNEDDLVNVLLSEPCMKSTMNDGFLSERELSATLSDVAWMFEKEPEVGIVPCSQPGDADRQEQAIMKRARSIGNFVIISEDPNDMKTPFVVDTCDGRGTLSSDESSDDIFSQEQHAIQNSKQFKLVCLAGYLKSLIQTASSSRHVASGVPCITPKSIEECLVPRKDAADDLVQCFFDSAAISELDSVRIITPHDMA